MVLKVAAVKSPCKGTVFESGLRFQGCSQWKCHVNRTTFQSGLKFQIGLSSLRVSCKRALSMWTESHKICKVRALINQVLLRCFLSYGVCLTGQVIKSVDISESVDINQSVSVNQFYPMETLKFITVQYFQLTWEEFVI